MRCYNSKYLRIISIITLAAFVLTQAAPSCALGTGSDPTTISRGTCPHRHSHLRIQQAKDDGVAGAIGSALGAGDLSPVAKPEPEPHTAAAKGEAKLTGEAGAAPASGATKDLFAPVTFPLAVVKLSDFTKCNIAQAGVQDSRINDILAVKDAKGVLYALNKRTPEGTVYPDRAKDFRWTHQNAYEYILLAHTIGAGLVNFCPIYPLSPQEVKKIRAPRNFHTTNFWQFAMLQSLQGASQYGQYFLERLSTTYREEELVCPDRKMAFARVMVFSVLIGMYDMPLNLHVLPYVIAFDTDFISFPFYRRADGEKKEYSDDFFKKKFTPKFLSSLYRLGFDNLKDCLDIALIDNAVDEFMQVDIMARWEAASRQCPAVRELRWVAEEIAKRQSNLRERVQSVFSRETLRREFRKQIRKEHIPIGRRGDYEWEVVPPGKDDIARAEVARRGDMKVLNTWLAELFRKKKLISADDENFSASAAGTHAKLTGKAQPPAEAGADGAGGDIIIMGTENDAEVVKRLNEYFSSDRTPFTRTFERHYFSQMGIGVEAPIDLNAQLIPALDKALGSDDVNLRDFAARVLGKIGKRVIPVFVRAIRSRRSISKRSSAVSGLRGILVDSLRDRSAVDVETLKYMPFLFFSEATKRDSRTGAVEQVYASYTYPWVLSSVTGSGILLPLVSNTKEVRQEPVAITWASFLKKIGIDEENLELIQTQRRQYDDVEVRTVIDIGDRTLRFRIKDKGIVIGIKFCRGTEEDRAELIREISNLSSGVFSEIKLENAVAKPINIDGNYYFSFKGIPKKYRSQLTAEDVDTDFAIVYMAEEQQGQREYFTYLPDAEGYAFLPALLAHVRDTARLAYVGLYDDGIVGLFHNYAMTDREDRSLFTLLGAPADVGMIDEWRDAVRFCNPRLGYRADVGHIGYYEWLYQKDAFEKIAKQLFSFCLISGVHYRIQDKEIILSEFKDVIKSVCSQYFEVYTGFSADDILSCIDWDKVAKRSAEEMNLDVERYTSKDTPHAPDLGTPNGPFPVPELIDAIYATTTLALIFRGTSDKAKAISSVDSALAAPGDAAPPAEAPNQKDSGQARAGGAAELEGKVAVIIDSDMVNAEITKGNLMRKGFDEKNVHIVVIDGIDTNAIEYGALGVTQELIEKIKLEIERLQIGQDIDLVICNITSAEVFLSNLRYLPGINVFYVSGREWEKEFQAITNSIGAAETSL